MTASAFHEWVTIDKNLVASGPVTENDVYSEIFAQTLEPINEDLTRNWTPLYDGDDCSSTSFKTRRTNVEETVLIFSYIMIMRG